MDLIFVSFSPLLKEKDEKRPWILRAKEASVQIQSKTTQEDSQLLPKTLIYISRGWNSFKEVLLSFLFKLVTKNCPAIR